MAQVLLLKKTNTSHISRVIGCKLIDAWVAKRFLIQHLHLECRE